MRTVRNKIINNPGVDAMFKKQTLHRQSHLNTSKRMLNRILVGPITILLAKL